jgi:cobalamin synthase
MNARRCLFLSTAVTAALLLALVVMADPALAQTSDVGKNVGREIKTWASAILLGVAGLVAIPVLAKRDVSGGLVLVLLVILVGGFVFAPAEVMSVIDGLWRAIGS